MNTSKTVLFISAGPIDRVIRGGQKRQTMGLNGGVEMLSVNGNIALLLQNNSRIFNGGSRTVRMIEEAANVSLADMRAVTVLVTHSGRGIVRPLAEHLSPESVCWVLCGHALHFRDHIARMGHQKAKVILSKDCKGLEFGKLMDEYLDTGRLQPVEQSGLIALAPLASPPTEVQVSL